MVELIRHWIDRCVQPISLTIDLHHYLV